MKKIGIFVQDINQLKRLNTEKIRALDCYSESEIIIYNVLIYDVSYIERGEDRVLNSEISKMADENEWGLTVIRTNDIYETANELMKEEFSAVFKSGEDKRGVWKFVRREIENKGIPVFDY